MPRPAVQNQAACLPRIVLVLVRLEGAVHHSLHQPNRRQQTALRQTHGKADGRGLQHGSWEVLCACLMEQNGMMRAHEHVASDVGAHVPGTGSQGMGKRLDERR